MLCAGAYYSACKGIRVDLPLDAVRYKELMDNLIEDEKMHLLCKIAEAAFKSLSRRENRVVTGLP